MALIKLTNKATTKKELVNPAHIVRVIPETSVGPADTVKIQFANGEEVSYTESPRSVNGYVKKAEAGEASED